MTLKQIDPTKIDDNFIKMIGEQWMLVTSGSPESFNMMTASWGFAGYLWGLPSTAIFVRPTRYTKEFIDHTHSYTLSFFSDKYKKILTELGTHSGHDMDKMKASGLTPIQLPTGDMTFNEATLTIVCRVMYASPLKSAGFIDGGIMPKWYPKGADDLHTMYVGQILSAYVHKSGLF